MLKIVVYAGWAFSQNFYKQKLYKKIGYKSVKDLIDNWANDHTKKNENEKKFISNSSLRSINSPYGHCAANPGNDKNFEKELDKNIRKLLN